jgi:hypothetical protein
MKLLFGFLLGIAAASAIAQAQEELYYRSIGVPAAAATGVGPDGRTVAIEVDASGRVFCSKE